MESSALASQELYSPEYRLDSDLGMEAENHRSVLWQKLAVALDDLIPHH